MTTEVTKLFEDLSINEDEVSSIIHDILYELIDKIKERAPVKCSICKKEGHNKLKCKQKEVASNDPYIESVLRMRYNSFQRYLKETMEILKKAGGIRLPGIPEDISENIIKFAIHKNRDTTSTWDCKGDLFSRDEGKQECKCFTSTGPLSFTPSSGWDIIYFMDATKCKEDKYTIYKLPWKMESNEWKRIKISNTQTFEDQCKQGRRPRITWMSLYPQISQHCTKIFDGTFEDLFC